MAEKEGNRREQKREERREERRDERRAKRDGPFWRLYYKFDDCLKNEDCCCAHFLGTMERNSGVGRSKIVLGICGFIALYLICGYGKEFLCNLIGFVYPAYTSIKAIESHEKDDDTKWLTYWVVFSLFSVVESFTDIFLSWIPFYYLLKCLFLLFCMAPTKRNGSTIIYKRIILPLFLRHHKDIDQGLDAGARAAASIGKQAVDAGSKVFSDSGKQEAGHEASVKATADLGQKPIDEAQRLAEAPAHGESEKDK